MRRCGCIRHFLSSPEKAGQPLRRVMPVLCWMEPSFQAATSYAVRSRLTTRDDLVLMFRRMLTTLSPYPASEADPTS